MTIGISISFFITMDGWCYTDTISLTGSAALPVQENTFKKGPSVSVSVSLFLVTFGYTA